MQISAPDFIVNKIRVYYIFKNKFNLKLFEMFVCSFGKFFIQTVPKPVHN